MKSLSTLAAVAVTLGAVTLSHAVITPTGLDELAKAVENAGASLDDVTTKASRASTSKTISGLDHSTLTAHLRTLTKTVERKYRGRPKGSRNLLPEDRPAAKRASWQRQSDEKKRKRRSDAKEDVQWQARELLRRRLLTELKKREREEKLEEQIERTASSEQTSGTLVTEGTYRQSVSGGTSYVHVPDSFTSPPPSSTSDLKAPEVNLFDLNATPPATP